jgi:hypothetical protein
MVSSSFGNSHTVLAGANGADNASSNGPLNETLSKLLWSGDIHIDAQNMQIGCGGHVVNISCQ